MVGIFILVTHTPLGRLQAPNPTLLDKRNVETPYRSPQGDSVPQGNPMAVRDRDVGRRPGRAINVKSAVFKTDYGHVAVIVRRAARASW